MSIAACTATAHGTASTALAKSATTLVTRHQSAVAGNVDGEKAASLRSTG
jgi:hypothetical protein